MVQPPSRGGNGAEGGRVERTGQESASVVHHKEGIIGLGSILKKKALSFLIYAKGVKSKVKGKCANW